MKDYQRKSSVTELFLLYRGGALIADYVGG